MAKTKIYVVGDKESGILFVTIEPLRVAVVSLDEVNDYAAKHKKTADAVFGEVAAAAQKMIIRTDTGNMPANVQEVFDAFGGLISRGSVISDAEFCFIADVDSHEWGTYRDNFIPLEPIVTALISADGGEAKEGKLKGP
ncbi:hypothetical protein [Taklimakanibacter lacteus]|uniref:hypothetical protein n=1 Tax=Taklimakanibacter lacteus TaxID=2268456 RepID=UPI000E66786B